ncbi:aldehyde dehydrogenase family protein, partial [Nesterenkonia haasae]|uniref:aldehyde dehydrogenase family protein n=1 Tax=Nesterenkonia haasae TaxID=2587813 RepID=UPI0013916E9D
GDEVDVDRAADAARAAFPKWSSTSRTERADVLAKLADRLEARADEIAGLICDEVGTPLRTAQRIQASLPVTVLRSYVDLLSAGDEPERIANTMVLREPLGVVAAIAPWNYPLHQVVAKLAPALAAGCTVVVKPSEVAPLTTSILLDELDRLDLPPGTVNLVNGRGHEVGAALAAHPEIDGVSFTGSVRGGTAVSMAAAPTVKRVTLELGGKSANVVLDDADLDLAVKVGVSNAFLNGGQTCTAWTRLVVPRPLMSRALELAEQFAAAFAPGDPRAASTKLGPMASASHRDSVREYIQRGIDDGSLLVTGGPEVPTGFESGFYVRPTVFGDVDPNAAIAQEEIFGPVLCVLGHDGDEDAIEIANNSRFGLHGSVWSADHDRAMAVARAMRTGTVDVNGASYNPLAPFGGYKQSGNGREMGRYGLEEFEEVKSIQVKETF